MNPCFGAKWEVPPRAECVLAHQRELPEGDRGHGLVAALQPQQLRGGVGGGGDVLAFSTADAADFVRRLDDTSDRIRREEHFLLVLSSFFSSNSSFFISYFISSLFHLLSFSQQPAPRVKFYFYFT